MKLPAIYSNNQFTLTTEPQKPLKQNHEYMIEIRNPRSLQQHKTFFKLVKLYFDNNQLNLENFEVARGVVLINAGCYHPIQTSAGTYKIPKSIAFESMPHDEFNPIMDNAIQYVADHLGLLVGVVKNHLVP